MKISTILKFGCFYLLLLSTPILTACGFTLINEAHTFMYIGFIVGLLIDVCVFYFLFEPLFKDTIKYARKKENERILKRN